MALREVTMGRFVEMLFSEARERMDLWWGDGGRVGMFRGDLLHVIDYDTHTLAEAVAVRVGGQARGAVVEVAPAALALAMKRESCLAGLLRVGGGDVLGLVGPVRVVATRAVEA